MIELPNPWVIAFVAEQRRLDLQAEAEHDRLGRMAERNGGDRRGRCRRHHAVVAVVIGLALLLAAGPALAPTP